MLKTLLHNRLALIGAILTSLTVLLVAFGGLLTPYSPTYMDFAASLAPPGAQHWFGTDSFGRDVLTRVLYGARVSLAVSVSGLLLGAAIGTAAGMIGAWHGGWTGGVIMRLVDLVFSFPSFVLALFMMVVLGYGAFNVVIALAVIYFPVFARLAWGMTLLVKDEPWVQAARTFRQSTASILLREILPNIAAPLLVQLTIGIAFGVIIEAGLSFLGLGVQPPNPSLGAVMADGREYFQRAPWVLTLTGAALSIALLGLNLLGDGMRDLVDPKLRNRK